MNNKYITNEDMYYVYSLKMFHFLKANDYWYKYKTFDNETKRYTYAFEKTDELMEAVTYYITNNNKTKELR